MKPVFVTRKPYSGLTRSLVIAIDVGTTFSGVSYAILDPGEVPQIHGVTRFPGQEHVAGNSKIPSILYYDKKGEVKAVGAEADSAYVQANAEDEGWVKVELFKLRLRPRTMNLSMNGLRLAPLPPRKSPVHIFGDFLSYLYTCTTSFIKDTHANGGALLAHVIPHHVEFVLSHPNGWEGAQQAKMRRAAIYGRLIDDTPEGRARIRFVTEGEASLHACVLSGLATDVLSHPGKHGFLIADAGGGTLDISSYAIKGTNPLVMEEVAPPDCIFAGSVFVSRRAREFFEHKLKGCKYGTPDSLDHITRQFDEKTKRLFRDSKDTQFVPFGSPFDKDNAFGIRNGQLRLTGAEVANLFEPSIDAAFNAIKKQIEACSVGIKSVFLVGGYAASPWLFSQLQERLRAMNVSVSRPDTQTSKAVADGAIGFYCDHHVSARMSKFMYGVEYLRALDPNDPEHLERKEKLCELPSGPKLLPDAFDCILARNVKVKESTVFSRKYCTELTSLSMLRVFEVEIWCYRGGNTVPKWIERRSETFSTLCIVKADLSMLSDSAAPKQGTNGKTYWTIVFSVEIHFGLTEFQARIKWVQNGETKYGPATIVYNERGHRSEEDEPDFYPEDDALTRSNSSRAGVDRHGSARQSSRARTPTDGHFIDSSRRSSRVTSDPYVAPSVNSSSIPEVSRVPSTKPASSNPATPSRSAYASLHDDKDDRRRSDRDSHRDRDRDRDRDSTRTRSNRSSLVPSAPGSPSIVPPSIAPPSVPSVHSSRSRGHTPTPTPGSPALSYVDPPLAPPTPKSAALPSPPKEPASLWDNTTPTATAPPEGAGLSRATSNASAFGTAKSISIFGEDPKSAFGTPGGGGAGVVDLLGGGDPTNGDRPTSIFGEEISTAPAFGSPSSALPQDKGMPGGLFDEPVDNASAGGWGGPPMSSIPRSVSISSRKASSLKGSPVVSRAPSGQGKPLSPLNPAAQQQAAVDSLAAAVAVLNDPLTSTTTLPKIDTNISPLSALSSAAPSAMGSGLTTPAAETPATPIGGASEAGTPVSVPGSAKKKKKKTGTAAVVAATAKREEEERQRKLEEEEAKAAAAAKKAQEEAEEAERQAAVQKAQAEAEEAARKAHEEEEQRKAAEAEAAAAEAKRLQEEEERKKQEEEQRLKEEEAKRKKEEEEAAKTPKKKPLSKKEERERKKKEEQERKDKERLEKQEKTKAEREERERQEKEENDRKEKERVEAEEKKRQEEEAQRKAEEARLEQERVAEEARKKAEEERLEQERVAEETKRKEEEERQRKEEEERQQREADERIRKKEEELRLEEERIARELADLEKQEEEARLQEERERKEREEEKRQQEQAREEQERFRKEEEARKERELRAREREERERAQKAEREKQQQQQSKAPSLGGFGSIWGGKATSFANSLFGGGSTEELPPPPTQPWLDTKQDVNESVGGWGSGFGVKKKPSISSIAKSTTGPTPLSRKPSQRSFQWGNAGATTTSAFDLAAPVSNPASSLFGGVNVNFDESQGIGLQDINTTKTAPTAEQEKASPPPPPPPKGDENPPADPWDIEMSSTQKKPGEDPTRTSTPTPEEEAGDDAWGLAPSSKKKKGKKGKSLLDLGGSEQPTREPSPAPGTPAEDPTAAQGTATAESEWAETTNGKKKKKGKKADAWGVEEPGTPAESPAAEGGGAENLQDQLADLLGNENEGEGNQAQTADAAEEWGLPVKTKKKKKKGGAVDDDAAAPSPIEAGAGGGDDGFAPAGKKKKKKR